MYHNGNINKNTCSVFGCRFFHISRLVNPDIKITDWQLKKEGPQPEKTRRWFNKTYGITFQTYQRMIRINSAFQDLKKNKKVTDSAFVSGYESLCGFGWAD